MTDISEFSCANVCNKTSNHYVCDLQLNAAYRVTTKGTFLLTSQLNDERTQYAKLYNGDLLLRANAMTDDDTNSPNETPRNVSYERERIYTCDVTDVMCATTPQPPWYLLYDRYSLTHDAYPTAVPPLTSATQTVIKLRGLYLAVIFASVVSVLACIGLYCCMRRPQEAAATVVASAAGVPSCSSPPGGMTFVVVEK
jgi:hypothetical protein